MISAGRPVSFEKTPIVPIKTADKNAYKTDTISIKTPGKRSFWECVTKKGIIPIYW